MADTEWRFRRNAEKPEAIGLLRKNLPQTRSISELLASYATTPIANISRKLSLSSTVKRVVGPSVRVNPFTGNWIALSAFS